MVKKPTITETIRLNRLRWFGHVQKMEENTIRKKVLHMNLEATRQRGKQRNTVESRSIVSTSIVFPHVMFAIFGPELSSI